MKPDTWTLYRYELRLRQPIMLSKGPLRTRIGWLLRVSSGDREGWGEMAPLPGYSLDPMERFGRILPDLVTETDALVNHLGESFPSVAFGFTMAWEDFEGRLAHAGRVPVNALIPSGTETEVSGSLELALANGFETVKYKVGRRDMDGEIYMVNRLRVLGGDLLDIRLDANRAWSLEDARRFAHAVSADRIEYLEEPLRDPRQIPDLLKDCPVPLALDETIRDRRQIDLRSFAGVKAFVIKPTEVGNLAEIRRVLALARDLGADPVFSACFESGLGVNSIAALAVTEGVTGRALGLDTVRFLAKDVVEPRVEMQRGFYDVRQITSETLHLNQPLVEQVAHGRY